MEIFHEYNSRVLCGGKFSFRVVRVLDLDFGRGSNFGDLNIVATPPRPASQTIATMRLFIAGCS